MDSLTDLLNEMGEKYGYTTKTFNLLALVLMQKSQFDTALKIFENALNELKLDSEEGAKAHLTSHNSDLSSLIVNYIKCLKIKQGMGEGLDFIKNNEQCKKLFVYLKTMQSQEAQKFFLDR